MSPPDHSEIYRLIEWIIVSMIPLQFPSDDSLQALRSLLPDKIIVAALDLIDRGRVTKHCARGRQFYEVSGSKQNYQVEIDLPSPIPVYCACPAFTHAVLILDNQPMCKHVLAVQIATRLNKIMEQHVTQDELLAVLSPEMPT